jgi:hypothetical protein
MFFYSCVAQLTSRRVRNLHDHSSILNKINDYYFLTFDDFDEEDEG